MAATQLYPPDLTRWVIEHWPEDTPLKWSAAVLDEALSAAFQASMTTEEGRPTRFRLLLSDVESLPEHGKPNNGVLRLAFESSRGLSADELRRLAPAAPFETSLIGAALEENDLRIWGIAHSGPAWLAPTWGGRRVIPNWSSEPIIHVTGPAQIAVRSAGRLIGALERGALADTTLDVFESDWVPAMFQSSREAIRLEHESRQVSGGSPATVEHSLIGIVSQQMLRRTIQLVRGANHGGLLLITDNPAVASRARGALRMKYAFSQVEPARRYRTLLLKILQSVASASTKDSVGWTDFALSSSAELEKLEQAVFEMSRVIANLAAIDGGVVLDKSFAILGFGAEVSAELPTPREVYRALDTEGLERKPDDIEAVGTRHRAAYRFVNDHPEGLAIVMSHDGGVTFVANRGGDVVYWAQSVRH